MPIWEQAIGSALAFVAHQIKAPEEKIPELIG